MKTNQLQNSIKISFLNKLHLLKMQELDLTEQTKKEFDEMYEQALLTGNGSFFAYESNHPKYLFLNYIIETKNVLLHGSNHASISCFEPKQQNLFNGKPVKAVFAASDAIWSLFFALHNRKGYVGSVRNLCTTTPTKIGIKRYYYFSVNQDFTGDLWTDGVMYIMPREPFKQGGIRNEWICEEPVEPLAKLSVTPNDFPFLDQVRKHQEKDSALKTIAKSLLMKAK